MGSHFGPYTQALVMGPRTRTHRTLDYCTIRVETRNFGSLPGTVTLHTAAW